METKFKVGDRVRLKDGLTAGVNFDGIILFDFMMFEGVRDVINSGRYPQLSNAFIYHPEMLELVKP